ncbi:hypothetical protein GCM10028822_00120 [Hymenobacter terrigena]
MAFNNPSIVCSIESVKFPNAFLRLDGTTVKKFATTGSGTANAQFGSRAWEKFRITRQPDGNFTIESVAFPNVFLRLDGTDVNKFEGAGAGTVNGQFGARAWEQFRIVQQSDNTFTIESVYFPDVFLRLDGRNITQFDGAGAGDANCQFGAFSWESFRLIPDLF